MTASAEPATQSFKIKGMHCASCANIIEKTFKKTEGVASAEVNYGTESAKIGFDPLKTNPESLSEKIKPLGYELIIPAPATETKHKTTTAHHHPETMDEVQALRHKVLVSIPFIVISAFIMGWDILASFDLVLMMPHSTEGFFRALLPLMATYMLFVVGLPYLRGLYRFLRYGAANMDTLIGLGTSVAYIYSFCLMAFEDALSPYLNVEHTYFDATIVVIGFITLGKYLEARAKLKTGGALKKLLGLQAKTALVVRNGKEQEIPISEVVHDDVIVIKPGGKIPVDGVILNGSSYLDEAMVTGEPMPIAKQAGDTVISGTINTAGSFTFRATKVGNETLLASIIRMVEQAQGSKAPIQALADRISAVFVPAVLVLALVAVGAWLWFGMALGVSFAIAHALTAFVSILVIACPCALGLATPTAIIVGVGKGAREGILIKDAATLEKLAKADVIAVDKTGTITKGKPEVSGLINVSKQSNDEVLAILAALESKSEHPVAHAILDHTKKRNLAIPMSDNFSVLQGKGVKGTVNGIEYYAGNARLMTELKIAFDVKLIEKEASQGKTIIVLADHQSVLALVTVADSVKPEASQAVRELQRLGKQIIMLTGDNKQAAEYIAKQAGIETVVAELLPQDKLDIIKRLQSENHIVAMTGDGVNDAPALAQADIGIAMGTGTDVAIETAGITLLHGDIAKLVKAVHLSRLTMRGIRQNLFWAFIFNLVGIPLAAGILYPINGTMLSPVFAGVAMAFSSVAVVSNSLRLKLARL